jgi:hypothetical protein
MLTYAVYNTYILAANALRSHLFNYLCPRFIQIYPDLFKQRLCTQVFSACPSQQTSAYRLCIRQHTSACRLCTQALSACPNPFRQKAAGESFFCRCSRCWVTFVLFLVWAHTAPTTHLRQHTSAYVSIRQHTSAYVSIRQHSSDLSVDLFPNVSIRQHTSEYVSTRQHNVSIRQHTTDLSVDLFPHVSIRQHTSAYVRVRQHTSAYVSIRQHTTA